MHKGKNYCFHPIYHAGRGWLWPGHPPWKMKLSQIGVSSPPWDIVNLTVPIISGIGDASGDPNQVDYVWTIPNPWTVCHVTVTLDTVTVTGVDFCRWRMTVGNGSGWSTAFALQEFPQRVVLCDSWDYSLPNPPYLPSPVPLLRVEPATWAESGSPYPPLRPP